MATTKMIRPRLMTLYQSFTPNRVAPPASLPLDEHVADTSSEVGGGLVGHSSQEGSAL